MTRIRIAAALAGTAALGLALTACGGSDTAGGPGGGAAVAPAAAATTKLAATQNDTLGQIVTDASGKTLYRFDADTASPSVSNCAGDCAVKWPPALVGKGRQVQLDGVDQALVGTVTRADGSTQLTLAGWPLYEFAKDSKPGDILGQGVGGTWFAATPQGAKAGQTAGKPGEQSTEQPAQPSEQPTQQPEQQQTEQPSEQPTDQSTDGSGDDYGSYGY